MTDSNPQTKIISPYFKLIFISAFILTLISIVILVFLSCQGELSDGQVQLFDICSTSWKMGFGAIVGLLGGKAT